MAGKLIMALTDPIGDMIARIKNAQARFLNDVKIPASKFRTKILDVLKSEGYIIGYKILADESRKNNIHVNLK